MRDLDAATKQDGQMTPLAQAILFWSSYSPLLVVFALLDTFGRGTPSTVCLVLAVLGCLALPALLVLHKSTGSADLVITNAEPRDADVLGYIASYLVPFASTQLQTPRERLAVGLFVAIIAVLYVRGELFYINPLLALAGIRIFRATTPAGTPVVVLCRRRFIPPRFSMTAARISDYVWMERRT